MIAIAVACGPEILICDEPTTALDVTIQAQVLKLMKELHRTKSAVLLITHDLGVVSQMATRLAVMKDAGVDILNVSGAARTPEIVAALRARYPDMAIIATGGPTDESILATIEAGANAITYTPPSSASLFAKTMADNRSELE